MKVHILPITACMLTLCACSKTASPETVQAAPGDAAKAAQEQPAKDTLPPKNVEARPPAAPPQVPPHIEELSQKTADVVRKNSVMSDLHEKKQLVGMHLGELEKWIGPPTAANDKSVIYLNDTGWGGSEWTLEVTNGVITAVQKQSLE